MEELSESKATSDTPSFVCHLKSMTGFGRATVCCEQARFDVEIQSINRKHLDIAIQSPPELAFLELPIRRLLSARIRRGRVNVRLQPTYLKSTPIHVAPSLALVKELQKAWQEIAQEMGLVLSAENLMQLISQYPQTLQSSEGTDEEWLAAPVEEAVQQALAQLLATKAEEGRELCSQIVKSLDKIQSAFAEIAEFVPLQVKQYRERLVQLIEKELPGAIESEERLLREVCLFADKVDIEEEKTRFSAHLQAFRKEISTPAEMHGKHLDFLLIELQREINTIAAKSNQIEISRRVVCVKAELEQIREQVSNIE